MKKLIFAAVPAIFMAGCADMGAADPGVKEEAIVVTGSHIPRKAGNLAYTNTQVVDKDELARQIQNQSATNNGTGR